MRLLPKYLQFPVLLLFFCFQAQAQHNSLLWEISGETLSTPSYLFGTIHITDKRVFAWSDSLGICFDRCATVAGELSLDQVNMHELAASLKMPGDTTLKMLLSKSEYKLVKKYVRKHCGVLVKMLINRIKPVYTSVLLGECRSNTQTSSKNNNAVSLDQYLQEMGNKNTMKVLGLETIAEQLGALEIMSLKEQAQALVEEVRRGGEKSTEDAMENMIQVYLQQDIDSLYSYFINGAMPDVFMESLIYKRNRIMAERMVPLMQEQATFVAVGAAHLAGEQGLIALLRKQGYKLRPVEFTFDSNKY
jgi:uncharacterized protein YbaP (TraB family)